MNGTLARPSRRPGWGLRALVALAVVLPVLVAVVALVERSAGAPIRLDVTVVEGSEEVTLQVDDGTTVAQALAHADVEATDGRLLAVASGDVLDAAHDPALLRLDGRTVAPDEVITASVSTIEVVDGTDEVEPTRATEAEIPVVPGPDVLRHVEERGAPGRSRQVVGTVSGEVASTEVLVEPRPPVRTERRVVALTFDDGPSAAWTPYVLEILRDRGVKATFCMVGSEVERRPEIAEQVVEEGHQLCNHTHEHDTGLADADRARVQEELAAGRAALVDHGLPAPGFYRPPGGYLSDTVVATAIAQQERVLMWKVDTKDWQRTATPDSVIANVRAQVEPGAVILLHDGGGTSRHTSLAVLPGLIDDLRAQGYEFTFPIIDPA